MKFKYLAAGSGGYTSPLAMAEWIEISGIFSAAKHKLSPLAMAEWIEMKSYTCPIKKANTSPLAMAEWIEITKAAFKNSASLVSASDGGVD